MAIKSIYHINSDDQSKEGKSIGAVINTRYRLPILKGLFELGPDSFHTTDALQNLLRDKMNLSDADMVIIQNRPIWHARIDWALVRLKEAGLVSKNSEEYKSWSISSEGKKFLEKYSLDKQDEIEIEKMEEARREVDTFVKVKKTAKKIRYWAGGFGRVGAAHDRLSDFIENEYWQALDYDEDDDSAVAKKARNLFTQIQTGDKFLIKGYGGTHDLKVYYVGEVISKDVENERIEFSKLDTSLYQGKAPRGSGAGNWFDTLLEVSRQEDIDLLFNGITSPEVNRNDDQVYFKHHIMNVIFYGPPGTGKTYFISEEILPNFILHESTIPKLELEAHHISKLPWWKVIAIAILDAGEMTVPQLKKHRFTKYKLNVSDTNSLDQTIWGQLSSHTVQESNTVEYTSRSKILLFNKKDQGSVWYIEDDKKILVEDLSMLLAEINIYQPVAETRENYKFITFHQSYSYEDFIEGIKPELKDGIDEETTSITYHVQEGKFYQACEEACKLAGFFGLKDCIENYTKSDREAMFKSSKNYGVFIDEINRGNVSAIFGELITLIEEDKRLGAKHEIVLTLPYSGRKFAVPLNLYIYGTMNTADRSVEALDTALRRRFSFKEMLPDSSVITQKGINGGIIQIPDVNDTISLGALLDIINKRIEVLLDRDHTIGHSFLMKVDDLNSLKVVFQNNIIPLLQEYFYGDYKKIEMIIGTAFFENQAPKPVVFATRNHDFDTTKVVYKLKDLTTMDHDAFKEAIGKLITGESN